MRPEDIQTPPSEVEQPTQGWSTQTIPEQGEVVPTSPVAAVQGVRKKRRWLLPVSVVLATLVLLAAAGFAGFYFLYRTPDAEYDAVLKDLDVMRSSAAVIPKDKEDRRLYDVALDEPRMSAAKLYVEALDRINRSPVFANDVSVRQIYDGNKEIVENYGQSSVDMLDTARIFQEVDTTCRANMNSLSARSITYDQLSNAIAPCEKLLEDHPHVPLKYFDEEHYVEIRDSIKSLLRAYRQLFYTKTSSELENAQEVVRSSRADFERVTSGTMTIHNTSNPTEQINKIVDTVKQRKSVTFRH